jgi:hypothetical protein
MLNVLEATPVLSFSPTSYDFGNVGQNQLVTTTVSIWNSGNGILYYFFDEGCDWIVADPWSGSSLGEIDEITLNAFTSPLDPGTHQCDVTINSSAGPAVLPVTINVVPRM